MPDLRFVDSPLLKRRWPRGRGLLLRMIFFGAFAGLAARAFWIQGYGNEFYRDQGRRRVEHTLVLPAARGSIVDRNGHLLATSLPVGSVWAAPGAMLAPLPEADLRTLAAALEIAPAGLQARLASSRQFVYLKRQIDAQVAADVAALDLPGIHVQTEWRRFFPEGASFAQIVGFTDFDNVGQDGLELSMNASLTGTPGSRLLIHDRLGRDVASGGLLQVPRDGRDLRLTLDARIQELAFSVLRETVARFEAKGGGAIVVDARTGSILALANWPSYDPNQRGRRTGEALRNRVVTDTFEPGSVIKPVAVGLALQQGRVQPGTLIDTAPGRITLGGRVIHDVSNHGLLTTAGVLQKSSNVGMVKIAAKLAPQDMWETFEALGLGRSPDIEFPGAASGRLRPWRRWRPIEQATMAYGYGLSVSLLQLAQLYTAFAGDGRVQPLTVIEPQPADASARAPAFQVFDAHVAAELRAMLELAASDGGTARRGAVPGYRTGGKTGTVRKFDGVRYAPNKYRSLYVGMAPMSAPRVITAVMIDEPSRGSIYGGAVAGPAFAQIEAGALKTLGIAPDQR